MVYTLGAEYHRRKSVTGQTEKVYIAARYTNSIVRVGVSQCTPARVIHLKRHNLFTLGLRR